MMNMRLLLALGGVVLINAQAEAMYCGYKDYLHLSDQSHPGIYIVSGFAEPDLNMQIVGPRSFVLRDTELCTSGYAHVTVAYDAVNYCVLDIKDGPWMMNPAITASCSGIRYLGTSYDGLGSYSYTINLD
ncbi:MAG: hypothetical protein ACHP6H_00010 [Legionellales bacterium]